MTNLTEKLDELQVQAAAQHTEMMITLNALAANTVVVRDALHYDDRGTPTPFVNLLVGIPDRLLGLEEGLNSLYLQLLAVNTKLLQLETTNAYLDSISVDTGALSTNVLALKNAVGTILDPAAGSVIWLLASLTNQLEVLNTDIGHAPDATTTINELLQSIRTCTCAVASQLPSAPSTQECFEQFASVGSAFYPTWAGFGSGVNVATWGAPFPTDVTLGSVFGITEDNTELQHVTSFNGAMIWVESTAPSFAISPLSVERFPTNEWVSLPAVQNIAISVDNLSSVKAYLCLPEAVTGDCYITGSFLQGDGDYVADFGAIPELEAYWGASHTTLKESEASYTFQLISGNGIVNPVRFTPGIPGADLIADIPYVTTMIPASAKVWYVRSLEPFTVEVCVNAGV